MGKPFITCIQLPCVMLMEQAKTFWVFHKPKALPDPIANPMAVNA